MKASVKEIKQFLDFKWESLLGGAQHLDPDDQSDSVWVYDDCDWLDQGAHSQSDSTLITLDNTGSIYWSGPIDTVYDEKAYAPLSVFKKWRKSLTTTMVACSIPKDKEEELIAFVKTLGGTTT